MLFAEAAVTPEKFPPTMVDVPKLTVPLITGDTNVLLVSV